MTPFELHHGDCIEVMRGMADDSVDAVVCDPPYGLEFMGKEWDGADGFRRSLNKADVGRDNAFGRASRTSPEYRAGHLFQEWCEVWAREALRLLKPGGHLLAFSGSRTYHRMTCAIEDAGFEVRDQIMWVYGTGFPKSLDVGKAIDKARVEDVEPVRVVCRAIRAAMDAAGLKSKDLTPHFDNCHPRMIDHWAARDTDSQPSLPTMVQWEKLRELLALGGTHDSEVARLNGRKGEAGDTYRNAEIIGEQTGQTPGFADKRFSTVDTSIRARSDAARQWDGWGTALKPAHEPICVARKPLVGTVAANVLAHGTGAINIDGCRLATDENLNGGAYAAGGGRAALKGDERVGAAQGMFQAGKTAEAEFAQPAGRWPANIIHDGSDEVVALFPDQTSGSRAAGVRTGMGFHGADGGPAIEGSTGSAARFFYCAKASRADRNEGLPSSDAPAVETDATMRECETADWSKRNGNHHPTVKPTDLMAYLVRLVTPPGGLVLDPFMGSGSTGKACMREGFRFVGIDLTAEYLSIARARIEYEWLSAVEAATRAATPDPQSDLFAEAA